MKMLGVVPLDKPTHPFSGFIDPAKSAVGIRRPVLQSLEQRLRIRIIIAHQTFQRGNHSQPLQSRQQGGPFHRGAIVGVKSQLSFGNPLLSADPVDQPTRMIAALDLLQFSSPRSSG